ncbi:uncharacterized protein KIAA1522 homolog isoform X2 [Myripristis murdjan]|uniref:uncharacterized protein KIAA1522 homolog isoform X2 n=1 Tax=Myripristis murdjan TaxID=586833 RepID=UPI00117609D0|nr:uncharacterized protein KIAA1522 homolog isoform X2 [Myripristis murdjan]
MSNRDSLGTGDLIPQDVVEVFAQERLAKRGHKKRSHSLGRALGWLKGKKRKDLNANGQSLGLGPGPDLDLDGHPAAHHGGQKGVQKAGKQTAAPKQDDEQRVQVPPLFQENVFIEASRPKYLEDLHTEAQEGLKLMQQEETNNGVYFQDDESTISSVTVQAEEDGGGFMTDSTIPDASSTVSTQSTVSTRSSRSGISRQGSTFRPLNAGKKPEKAKTRRRSRKTVMGIPHHVQKELGLDRTGMTISPILDKEQLPNGETINTFTTDGPQQAAELQQGTSVSLQNIETLQPLSEDQVQQFNSTQAFHRDDLALLHRFGPELSDQQRPHSLAVPWMTTANSLQQQPPSPVMSMSPQATYLSKIIPNAVMPPAIDVVEISRGRSRNSVRTVSKSSLLLASPASSRASSRASTLSSASKHKPPKLSDSSGWSNSESSETLVSDSSTISSSSTPRQKSQDGDLGSSAKEDKVSVHSSISKSSKSTSNGKPRSKVGEVKKDGAFVRSLSVMKSKKAPPPPSRSYSLHNKMKRRSRDLAEVRVISGESSPQSLSSDKESTENKMVQIKEAGPSPMPARTIDSPGYSADISSMDDSTGSSIKFQLQTPEKEDSVKLEEPGIKDTSPEKKQAPPDNEVKKIVSPSSGYSSQDGTPTQPSKQSHRSSPRHKKGILVKLQSLFPKSSPAPTVSAPSPLKQPDVTDSKKSTEPPQPQPNPSVDTVTASPSVKALRELFNIPPPPNVHAPPPPPPEVWAHNKRTFELLLGPPAPDNTYAIVKKNPKDRRQQRQSPPTSKEGSVKSMSGERKQKDHTSTVELNSEVHKEINERLAHVEPHVDVKENSKVTEKDEKVRVSELLSGMLMKVAEKREQRLAAMQQDEVKPATHSNTSVTEVKTKMDTLPAISLVRVSPAPSPPPPHHPPQPPTKQDTHLAASDAASAVTPHLVVSPTSESLWPPPPPPMEQASGILGGNDVMDFPLPPPPLFSVEGLVIPVQVPPEQHIPSTAVLQDSNSEQLNSACTITSVASVVNAECLRVAAGTLPSGDKPAASEEVVSAAQPPPPAPKMYLMSQGIPPPPPSIPPPPPFAAPTAPVKEGSPPAPKEVSPPPPPKEVSPPPPPKEVSPPPPPKDVSPPAPKEVSPPPPKEVSPPPPPKEVSPPPPPKDVSPAASQEVSPPPPPKEVSPPPPKEVSPPPPPKDVSPTASQEVSPPPPPKEVSPPPPKEVSPPPPPKEVSPPPPKEVSPPPPPKDVSPPPPKEVSPPPPPKEVSTPPPPKEISPPPPKEVSPPPPVEVSSPLPKEVSTPLPPKEVSPPSAEEVALLLSQEPASSSVSILLPPQSIPPPPPSEPPQTDDSHPAAQEPSPPPPSEIPILPSLETSHAPQMTQEHTPPPPINILSPPPLPVQAPANTEHQTALLDAENRSQEQTSPLAPQEEATPMTTSLLEVVKLKSVNSSPDPIKPQDQTQPEVIMRTQNPSNQGQAPSAAGEAPQKPIRRSLIITSPTSTSPPAIVTSQPTISKSQTTMVLPTSSSTVISPTKKSPPAISSSPSMNLQEAIRLRTAARSKDGPTSRLSLPSPTSPLGGDFRKSPSSTASFIFSKSTKKVVIETVTSPEANSNNQKNLVAELSSVTKSANETELLKKGAKVPPPVAKKPKPKAKEIESSVETEQMQTAGQEAQPESTKGTPEKPNGTAGSAEGGQTST